MDSELSYEKMINLIITVASKERLIELKRQLMCDKSDFEPYVAFQRIARNPQKKITSSALQRFMNDNLCDIPFTLCASVISLYCINNKEEWNYTDFLSVVLPKEHPELRAIVAQKNCYDLEDSEYLSYEVEYCLAEIILLEASLIEELIKITKGVRCYSTITQALIKEITFSNRSSTIYDTLKRFIQNSGALINDSEILSFIRRIDSDDDGIVSESRIEKFFLQANERSSFTVRGVPNQDEIMQKTPKRNVAKSEFSLYSPSISKSVSPTLNRNRFRESRIITPGKRIPMSTKQGKENQMNQNTKESIQFKKIIFKEEKESNDDYYAKYSEIMIKDEVDSPYNEITRDDMRRQILGEIKTIEHNLSLAQKPNNDSVLYSKVFAQTSIDTYNSSQSHIHYSDFGVSNLDRLGAAYSKDSLLNSTLSDHTHKEGLIHLPKIKSLFKEIAEELCNIEDLQAMIMGEMGFDFESIFDRVKGEEFDDICLEDFEKFLDKLQIETALRVQTTHLFAFYDITNCYILDRHSFSKMLTGSISPPHCRLSKGTAFPSAPLRGLFSAHLAFASLHSQLQSLCESPGVLAAEMASGDKVTEEDLRSFCGCTPREARLLITALASRVEGSQESRGWVAGEDINEFFFV